MAAANPLWGAERVRGELLKLNIRVATSTIQRYLREARPPRHAGQPWATFLRNHAPAIWACDFLPVTDLLFRPLFAFFLVELGSRQVVHVGVTRHPTDAWVAQQLREATPYGERPRFLVRDNDAKYGPRFAHLAAATGIAVVRTPVRAPRANAIAERFLRSVRRECLDHLLLLGEAHLRRVLGAYVAYFNQDRPTRGWVSACRQRVFRRSRRGATRVRSSPARSSAGCTTPTGARPEAASGGRTYGPVASAVTRPARSALPRRLIGAAS